MLRNLPLETSEGESQKRAISHLQLTLDYISAHPQ
jgi:hypothetical protein